MTQREGEGGRERTAAEIQAEIGRTRADIQQDLKTIGEKLSPEQFKQNAKGVLSDAKQEGATMIRETKEAAVDSLRAARDQTIDSVSGRAHDLTEQARRVGNVAGDYAQRASERAGEYAQLAKERAGEYAHMASDRAGEYAHRAGDYAQRAGSYARQAGVTTGDFVTANAVPLSLIGLGVGWLALSLRKQRALQDDRDRLGLDGYLDEVDEFSTLNGGAIRERSEFDREHERALGRRVAGLTDGARSLAESARERVGTLAQRSVRSVEEARTRALDAASQLGHQASELSHEARARLAQAQTRTIDFAEENPLAVGAIAVAAGIGIGLLLPISKPENRLLGGARDRLVGDARELLQDARDAGGRMGQKAKETAEELRGTLSDRLSH